MASDESQAIETLIRDTRTAREAVHALVARLQHDRAVWKRQAEALTRRTRLTTAQRRRFQQRLGARR